MKKLIRLTEGDLHKIVNESVKRILTEQKFSIDPANLARELFNNGDDFTLFVHWLEKTYSMLQAGEQSQPSDPKMALVQAIKNSKTFVDTARDFNGEESGEADLHHPLDINGWTYRRIGYGIEDGNVYFYGYDRKDEEGYWSNSEDVNIRPKEIPQVIKYIA